MRQDTISTMLTNYLIQWQAQSTAQILEVTLRGLQKDFAEMKNQLSQPTVDFNIYLQAYDLIMRTREFLTQQAIEYIVDLPAMTDTELSQVDRTISIKLDHQRFMQLIDAISQKRFDGLKSNRALYLRKDNLRFGAAFQTALKLLIQQTNNSATTQTIQGFQITYNDKAITPILTTPYQLNKYLATVTQSVAQEGRLLKFYFMVRIPLPSKLNEIPFMEDLEHHTVPVTGTLNGSTVFSAVARYAIEEKQAREEMLKTVNNTLKWYGFNNIFYHYNFRLNRGNMTEAYERLKLILNNGHNHFKSYQWSLKVDPFYYAFRDVRKNTDPFYRGGDILTFQIKSFVGALPSLVNIQTIKETIDYLYDVFHKLQKNNSQEVTQQLSNFFTKSNNTSQMADIISETEQQRAEKARKVIRRQIDKLLK